MDEVKKIADEVHGHSIEKPCDALDQAAEDLKEILGADPPPPPQIVRDADRLLKKGRISQRAYEKMVEKAS